MMNNNLEKMTADNGLENSQKNALHKPVLFQECVDALNIQENGIYIDATFGRGGHSSAILSHLSKDGHLIVIDKDLTAIAEAKELLNKNQEKKLSIHHSSFANIKKIAEQENVYGKVNGILFDLGVSSPQLDTAERGFSFLRDGPLDMRMDQNSGVDAASWLKHAKEEDIAHVLYFYGEERYSRRLAKKIVEERALNPITRTLQLAQLIADAHPAWEKHKHPATKSFQAIRIFINHELDELEQALACCVDILANNGRLVVISFHSLEDRIVKRFLKLQSEGVPIPAHVPVKEQDRHVSMRRIGKAIRATKEEVSANPRARSATLRIGEKIT